MKRQMLKAAGTAVMLLMASTGMVLADQARPRSPGSEGSSGGSSGSSGSGGGSDTGRVAMPRGGGSSDGGGGGSVSSQPTRPSGGTTTRTRGGRGGDDGSVSSSGVVPGYSRPRDGATATGRAVPRATVGALPPIIAGPVYWGAGDSWYFYPWGFGGMGLGYLWDPWAWGGYGGAWGAGYPGYGYGSGYGGYGGYGGYSGYTDYESSGGGGYSSSSRVQDPDVTGSVRLKVTPRLAEVHVDGYFAGRVDDFDGAFQKLKLPPGPHRVELKANGFETLAFDVLVVENEVTTYRGDLKPTP